MRVHRLHGEEPGRVGDGEPLPLHEVHPLRHGVKKDVDEVHRERVFHVGVHHATVRSDQQARGSAAVMCHVDSAQISGSWSFDLGI